MSIIASNCIAGFLYRSLHKVHDTPFVWNAMKLTTFIDVINQYEKLITTGDIRNIKAQYTTSFGKPCPCIIVNNKLEVAFPHHHQDDKAKLDYIRDVEYYSNDILACITNKWLKRCDKLDVKDKRLFIYDDLNQKPYWETTDCDVHEFIDLDAKKILITTNKDLLEYTNDSLVVVIKDKMVVNTKILANMLLADIKIKEYLLNNC